jgi:hypothetical protein
MHGLQTALAPTHRACRYDRAGQGQSEPASSPRTAADVVADLHGLLAAANVPGPYVLIGQSAGGSCTRAHPADVVGVISINAVAPADPWRTDALPLMTAAERNDEQADYRGADADEGIDRNASFAQLDAAPPPEAPFLALISTIAQCDSPTDVCGRTHDVYERLMRDLAGQWPRGAFVERPGPHELYAQPDVVASITQ